jgi:hypothetical protein
MMTRDLWSLNRRASEDMNSKVRQLSNSERTKMTLGWKSATNDKDSESLLTRKHFTTVGGLVVLIVLLSGCTKGSTFGVSRVGQSISLVKHACDKKLIRTIEIRFPGENDIDDEEDEIVWKATASEPSSLGTSIALDQLPKNWTTQGQLPKFTDDRHLSLFVTWENDVRSRLSLGVSYLEEGFVRTWRYGERIPLRKFVESPCD